MSIPRRTVLLAVGSSVAIAGCLGDEESDGGSEDSTDGTQTDGSDDSGDDDSESESENENETDDEGESDATVRVRSHPDHGDILVGPEELTLYNFDQDTQDEMASTCYDDCATAWPPLTVEGEGDPTAGDDVSATLTTFERNNGETQVAADGWPLYYFASDEEPGDVNGQGVNDVWWVLKPDGTPMRPDDSGGSGDDGNSDETDDTDDSDSDDDDGVGY
ncbi:COG4315 family predicted lipoprotein [Natronosalvus caseinilyticus]|uniref:COG4315 family predicted lipoprotein n=1 Tax=Natronosalvus caseinilyticus TaxID=2953747 RepID=UPI0028A5E394|nr:hypothetical protein [Natronosalvus caseinilyticus]